MQVAVKASQSETRTMYNILFLISLGHFLNDSMQSVIPAIFPIIGKSMSLSFTQIGWIAFVLNMTSSIMQPVFGYYADKRSSPFLLPLAMSFSMIGMVGLAFAPSFYWVLLSVFFVGLGSAIFHPEGSRVAYMAAGEKRGLAQSIYQVGGNTGQSMAPLFTAFIFVPLGQIGSIWFTVLAAVAIVVLLYVSTWYKQKLRLTQPVRKQGRTVQSKPLKKQVKFAMALLVFLVFARSWYGSGISNYYQFYLIDYYNLTIKSAQFYLFVFMIAGVLGTFFGGPLADRFGKRNIMMLSMLGAAPLTLLLPYVPLIAVTPFFFLIGFILSSSFSVTVVYAQELLPGKIGMVSGLIVGLAFGMGALGSIVLGKLADVYSLRFIMILCSFLPLIGVLTWLLPTDKRIHELNQ
ncbi:MFS transporter [Metabacillus iocasae]|uniref:FSR family fosmidomycin resistance protein-like MFS transporter n=1 Tax=Priestia iocasae TaxID=2291674 RepID=A0ABS2QW75_9BACI|nr:MFS transporter [Metabacillus iocasae]MBM7703655.1 FSR family fosmidomycin resistance protein-like MFS transporter [Metabacillus iocasae]